MKRKLIVIFAALALSACMLTGCGGDKKDDSKTEPTTVSATQATTAAATESRPVPQQFYFLYNADSSPADLLFSK